MKKIICYIALFIFIVIAGCKKLVDETPLSSGTLDQFFKSKYDADAAMAGLYGQFQQTMVGEAQFNNRYTFWGEGRSDNFEKSGYSSSSTTEMHFNSLTANNTFSDWSPLYTVIGRANLNILKFPDINKYASGSNQIDKTTFSRYMAECYAMRAISYFYIVRNWGDAVVLTAPYLDIAQEPALPRSPKDSVLNLVISDLTNAYNIIPKGASPTVWYISEGAICASLADVYMWKKDYQNAIKWIQLLFKAKGPTGKTYNASGTGAIGSGGTDTTTLESTATWKNQFTNPQGSMEAIWSIHWDVSANGCPCMAGVSTAVNNSPMIISADIFNSAWANSTTDVRPKQTFDVTKKERDRTWKWYPGTFGSTGPAGKYTGTYGTDLNVYLPMYRLADQYLLYAEALNKIGDLTDALKYLNIVHKRAGLTAYTATQFPDQTSMENAILQERQWELFGEGKRWYDLVRTDHVFQVMDPIVKKRQLAANVDTIGFGDPRRILWPINRNVLNANSKLIQNPPYSG